MVTRMQVTIRRRPPLSLTPSHVYRSPFHTGAVLDDCGAPSAAFKLGFTKTSGTGTIVQKSSGMCLTFGGATPNEQSYQPMQKKGAIILATGGDNSNSAKGNFYEGFMATGQFYCSFCFLEFPFYNQMQESGANSAF